MTIEQLWDEYRTACCESDLDEPGGPLYLQRIAFMAGAMATIGNIMERPSCFEELRESIAEWIAERQLAADVTDPDSFGNEREPIYQVALTFMRRPLVSCFGLPGLMDFMRRIEPGLYTVSDLRGREVAVALRKSDGDYLVEFENGTKVAPGCIIV